jgi:ribosomal protein S18 acetylase RimI-like enzyme
VDCKTIEEWDEELWKRTSSIYHEAFAEKGAKPEKVIRNMFRKQLCFLHVAFVGENIIAMAISGKLKGIKALLIDYIAVKPEWRSQGIGLQMMKYIKNWAIYQGNFDSLIIEVESDSTVENHARIDFWKKCGFTLTDYIHQYIWVPEPYQSMYIKLLPEANLPENGEDLFKYIGQFHKYSFQNT